MEKIGTRSEDPKKKYKLPGSKTVDKQQRCCYGNNSTNNGYFKLSKKCYLKVTGKGRKERCCVGSAGRNKNEGKATSGRTKV